MGEKSRYTGDNKTDSMQIRNAMAYRIDSDFTDVFPGRGDKIQVYLVADVGVRRLRSAPPFIPADMLALAPLVPTTSPLRFFLDAVSMRIRVALS